MFVLNRSSFILPFLTLGICLFLTACGNTGKETAVTGLCGSCKPYYVRGSMHYPQRHYEYDETGLASWYGPGFHGKPKPLGEKFNQHTMTAAHATLPLPTIVRVTNEENGRSIVVLVDDRGPFTYDRRIIDLSMEAAKRLGSYAKGIARVRVQSLVEDSKALSDYLAKHGHHMRKDRFKRTWLQIYEQEILKKKPHPTANDYDLERLVEDESAQIERANRVKKPKLVLTSGQHKHNVRTHEQIAAKKVTAPAAPVAKHTHYVPLQKVYKNKAEATKALKVILKKYPAQLNPALDKKGKMQWGIKVGPLDRDVNSNAVKKTINGLMNNE